MFASARDAAGCGADEVPGATVGEVLAAAEARYGERFSSLLPSCRVWLNGEETSMEAAVAVGDEIAVLPPVSGGCGAEVVSAVRWSR